MPLPGLCRKPIFFALKKKEPSSYSTAASSVGDFHGGVVGKTLLIGFLAAAWIMRKTSKRTSTS
jgi:hypothetical protein